MRIRIAHLRTQGIDFAVFAADATAHTDGAQANLLADLTRRARAAGLRIEKSALAYMEGGRPTYYGTSDLVRYLANNGVSHWTHELDT